jgi:hypothetical protein
MSTHLPPPVTSPPDPHPWEWSISEAWVWLGHFWVGLVKIPYLGLLSLVLAALLVTTALVKLLSSR